MPETACYFCGEPLEKAAEAHCSACGRFVVFELAREIAALRRVIETVDREQDLDSEVEDRVQKLLKDRTQQLVARGHDLEQSAQRAATPPPPPTSAEPPPRADADAAEAETLPTESPSPEVPPTDKPPPESPPSELHAPVRQRARRRRVDQIGAGRGGPSIWARLGPAFGENLLFALATFLIVGGALYFVTTAWTTMTGTQRLLVVFGGVQLFGALLYGAERLLNRGGTLPEVERIVLRVVAFLVPLATVAAGEVLAADRVAGLFAALIGLATGWLALRGAARSEHAALHPMLTHWALGLSALALLAPHLGTVLEPTALVTAGLLWAGATVLRNRGLPALERLSPLIIGTSLLAFAAVATTAAVALAAAAATPDTPLPELLAPLSFLLAAAALYLGATATALAVRNEGRHPTGVLLSALALAVAALPIASANPRCLLVAAAAATWTAGALAFRLNRAVMLWPALALSAVTYFLLPAPVRQLAMAVRDSFAESLGYAPTRLPLSFYGISFLPYVAGLVWWTGRLRRHANPRFTLVVSVWAMAVASGLSVLSITAGSDARAPMAVLGAQGLLLLVLGWGSQRQRFVFAGLLGLLGSLVSSLIWFEIGAHHAITALSGTGLLLIAAARLVGRDTNREVFGHRAAYALLDAALVCGIGTAFAATFPQLCGLRPPSAGLALWNVAAPVPGDIVPYAALALLLACLAAVFRRLELSSLAALTLGASGLGVLSVAGESVTSAWSVTMLGALSWVALAAHGLRHRLPIPTRPLMGADSHPELVPVGMLLLHLATVPALVHATRSGVYGWPLLLGLAGAAGASATAAVRWRIAWPKLWSALLVCTMGVLAAGVLGLDPATAPGAAGLALGALCLLARPLIARSARGGLDQVVAYGAVPIAFLWLLLQRIESGVFATIPANEAAASLLGSAALVGAATLAPRAGPSAGVAWLSQGAGGLALGLLAFSILDLTGARPEVLPLALVSAAAIAGLAPAPASARAALVLVHLMAGLALAFAVPIADRTGAWWQTAAFALAAVIGHRSLRPLPVARTLVVFVGVATALWLELADAFQAHPTWLLAVVPTLLTAATLLQRWPVSGLERIGVTILSTPVLALLLFVSTVHAVAVMAVGDSFLSGGAGRTQEVLSALAFALFAVTRSSAWGGTRGLWLGALSVALATFVAAPCNLLVHSLSLPTGASPFPLPDLDIAVLALALAVAQRRAGIAYFFAVAGLLLTAGEHRHLTTPMTCAAAALVPLALWWRARIPFHLEVHGYASMVAVWSFAAYLVPDTGRPAVEILPLLAALSTALAFLHHVLSGKESTRVLTRVSTVGTALAIAMVAINAVVQNGQPAPTALRWLALGATLPAAAVAVRRALLWKRPTEVHWAVAAVIVGYAFGVLRTDWLTFLDGYHLHALAALGALLLLLGTAHTTAWTSVLVLDGLLLPIPAVLAALADMSARGAAALLMAAALYGYAAHWLRHRLLPWVSLTLLNAALFSLWQHHGVVDPAFYGVPAGLSLILGSEIARRSLEPTPRLLLWWLGLTLLYGSVAVQVLRVEEPLHALVLFVAGLLAVGWGFLRNRTGYLLAGTAAVVLDVVAYLIRHGLERDFVGAALLVGSGLTVLTTAAITARQRRRAAETDP